MFGLLFPRCDTHQCSSSEIPRLHRGRCRKCLKKKTLTSSVSSPSAWLPSPINLIYHVYQSLWILTHFKTLCVMFLFGCSIYGTSLILSTSIWLSGQAYFNKINYFQFFQRTCACWTVAAEHCSLCLYACKMNLEAGQTSPQCCCTMDKAFPTARYKCDNTDMSACIQPIERVSMGLKTEHPHSWKIRSAASISKRDGGWDERRKASAEIFTAPVDFYTTKNQTPAATSGYKWSNLGKHAGWCRVCEKFAISQQSAWLLCTSQTQTLQAPDVSYK